MHHATALSLIVLLITGAILYIGPLGAAVGDRGLIASIHIYVGVFSLLPVLSALGHSRHVSPTKDALVALSRWTDADRRWIARLPRLDGPRSSRFNAGQKLNANTNFAGLLLMLLTGLIMASYLPVSIATRQGATFIHDLIAFLLASAFLGHLTMALTHSDSLRAMFGRAHTAEPLSAKHEDRSERHTEEKFGR
jgi:formate dehydrogenase subunit gamma